MLNNTNSISFGFCFSTCHLMRFFYNGCVEFMYLKFLIFALLFVDTCSLSITAFINSLYGNPSCFTSVMKRFLRLEMTKYNPLSKLQT